MFCGKAQDGVKRLGKKNVSMAKEKKKKEQNPDVSNGTKKLRSLGFIWPFTFTI